MEKQLHPIGEFCAQCDGKGLTYKNGGTVIDEVLDPSERDPTDRMICPKCSGRSNPVLAKLLADPWGAIDAH
jgi:hypothetical protein